MPALVTLHGIDQALAALDLKSGTLKALLVEAIRSYFPDNETLLTITAIPTDELVAKIYGVDTAAEIKARKKNFSSLKSGLNKQLRELDADQNPEGVVIGRDNVFIVSEERKDNLIRELGLAAESTQTLREMFRSFKKLFNDVIKEKGVREVHDLIREFDETRRLIEGLGDALPTEVPPAGAPPTAAPIPVPPAPEPAEQVVESPAAEAIEEIGAEEVEIVEAEEVEEVATGPVEEDVEELPPGEIEEVVEEELEEVAELPATEGEPLAGEGLEIVAAEEIEEIGEEELEEVEEVPRAAEAVAEPGEIEEIAAEELEEIAELPATEGEPLAGEGMGTVAAAEIEEISAEELEEVEEAPFLPPAEAEELGEEVEAVEAQAAEEGVEEPSADEIEEIAAEELEEIEEVPAALPIEEIAELPAAEEATGKGPETVAPEEIAEIGKEEFEEVEEVSTPAETVEEPEHATEIVEAEEVEEVTAEPAEEGVEALPPGEIEEVAEEEREEAPTAEEVEEVSEEELEDIEEVSAAAAGKPGSPLDLLSKYLEADEAVAEAGDYLKETDEEYAAQILNRFMPKFVHIPAGDYLVGSAQPKGLERPQQRVTLPSFYLGQFPVTNDLFDLFVRETGYETEAETAGYGIVFEGRCATTIDPTTGLATVTLTAGTSAHHVSGASWRHPNGPESAIEGRHLHPVVQVSHKDAMAFAAWSGKRLPTEEEWEAAARGPHGQLFPWGNTWLPKLANLESSCLGDTMPVDRHGREAMSHFGIHDLVGNVYEWTATIHQRPGAAKATGSNIIYVLKGGCWTSRGVISTTHREIERGYYWSNTIGFRCAV